LQCGAVCCSVLQCVAVCCSVLRCVAVCVLPARCNSPDAVRCVVLSVLHIKYIGVQQTKDIL